MEKQNTEMPPPSRKPSHANELPPQPARESSSMPPLPAVKTAGENGQATSAQGAAGSVAMPPPSWKPDKSRGGGTAGNRGQSQQSEAPASASMPAAAQHGEGGAMARPEAASPAAPPAYTPPAWAGVPEGVPYSLEVLKGGAIVEARDVNSKDHYTFGRTPGCDFVLEHPSASRLHAVLQFNGSSKAAHVLDNASTHGTYVNKQRIKPHVHVPIRVGDTLKFGQSGRLYLLCGPDELLPEEGLTRSQKAQLAQLEYAQRMKERDLKQSAAAMEAALSSGASWGMQEDAVEEPDEDAIHVDWRAMLAANKLTEKQLKQAEKIRQKEYKIKNLQTEIDRIVAKEKLEAGLTPGQVSTLARNEQAMEALRDELEDLEEALVDSVKDAVTDRNKVGPGGSW
ncbi:SMAD/FHA domain-containing protein [Dunaliella salina]|uniref:SMAD/FHA domain-containing protein n=1 Tax=Dunaliella salina TaxID=3046 RepID=A0ABQ7GP51_DUNSA|nr:SMAD/FHA domain-containing protein [Dunaliella salina]|eukprot:KAF5836383.1 SMAD/FHA domain-containing protein [Dunaliella salina]